MGDTLMTAIQTKQDLYKNSYKITINWGTIKVLENVFYTKVSRIRRLTNSPKFIDLFVLKQRKNSSHLSLSDKIQWLIKVLLVSQKNIII